MLSIVPAAYGQTIMDTVNERVDEDDPASQFEKEVEFGEVAPSLFEDEFDDIGPQYLLKPGVPQHDWFSALLDIQWFNSSNPTLAEKEDRQSADLFVLTAQLGVVTPSKNLFGGQWDTLSGIRYQKFDYGTISGDILIDGRRISESNFQANTVFSDVKWKRKSLKAQFGLRWTSLDNRSQGEGYYTEFVPNWSASRDFIIATNTMLTFDYNGSWVISSSEVGGSFIRDDFNDRVSNAIGLSALHRLTPALYFQPSIRVNYSIYTDDLNGDREDTTYSLGFTLSYYLNSQASIRLFTNLQKRHSTGLGIVDYRNVDSGVGFSFGMKF